MIWNLRDMSSEVNQVSFEIYSKYCSNFKGFGGGIQKDDIRIKQFFENNYEYLDALTNLFEKYSKDNVLTMANKTVAYIGKMG